MGKSNNISQINELTEFYQRGKDERQKKDVNVVNLTGATKLKNNKERIMADDDNHSEFDESGGYDPIEFEELEPEGLSDENLDLSLNREEEDNDEWNPDEDDLETGELLVDDGFADDEDDYEEEEETTTKKPFYKDPLMMGGSVFLLVVGVLVLSGVGQNKPTPPPSVAMMPSPKLSSVNVQTSKPTSTGQQKAVNPHPPQTQQPVGGQTGLNLAGGMPTAQPTTPSQVPEPTQSAQNQVEHTAPSRVAKPNVTESNQYASATPVPIGMAIAPTMEQQRGVMVPPGAEITQTAMSPELMVELNERLSQRFQKSDARYAKLLDVVDKQKKTIADLTNLVDNASYNSQEIEDLKERVVNLNLLVTEKQHSINLLGDKVASIEHIKVGPDPATHILPNIFVQGTIEGKAWLVDDERRVYNVTEGDIIDGDVQILKIYASKSSNGNYVQTNKGVIRYRTQKHN